MAHEFKILLFYKYVELEKPDEVCEWQKKLCKDLQLKGRVLISGEGINGTVAGLVKDIDAYMETIQSAEVFSDMEWKVDFADAQVFPRLRVVVRDEIVTLNVKKTGSDVSLLNKAEYIEPEQLDALYESGSDFLMVDARNDYETQIGRFEKAVIPSLANFRDFPAFVERDLSQYKDRPVVTYCTGGVRCEKASAYLREQGFTNVRQLHGGIFDYAQKTGGRHFEGEMFVFDNRLHVEVNSVQPKTIAACIYCKAALTRLVDCAAFGCDELFVACEECEMIHASACSVVCEQKARGLLGK